MCAFCHWWPLGEVVEVIEVVKVQYHVMLLAGHSFTIGRNVRSFMMVRLLHNVQQYIYFCTTATQYVASYNNLSWKHSSLEVNSSISV